MLSANRSLHLSLRVLNSELYSVPPGTIHSAFTRSVLFPANMIDSPRIPKRLVMR